MELGTGVFLSAIFLGTVALYIATKDRWNWTKIFLWPVAIVLGLSITIGTAVYLYDQIQSRPVQQMTLWGIALRASPTEIKFLKGEPSQRLDDDTWRYLLGDSNDSGSYVVRFKDGKVRFIAYDGAKLHAPTIAGISPYSSLEDLEKKLGVAAFISRSKDELQRWYSFDKYNVIALIQKSDIVAFGIYDAQTGPMRFHDESP